MLRSCKVSVSKLIRKVLLRFKIRPILDLRSTFFINLLTQILQLVNIPGYCKRSDSKPDKPSWSSSDGTVVGTMFAFKYMRGKKTDRRIQDEKEWKEAGKEGERSEESSGGKERVEDH